jgi:hypothetical protein
MPGQYKPRRAGQRWRENAPDYILDCFDNRGATADRYSVLMYWPELEGNVAVLGMSSSPTNPQGVSMWSEYHGRELSAYRYREGHHRVKWSDLPANIRQHVEARASES